jgi:hypothetical protein
MTTFSFTAIAVCAVTLIVPGAASAQQRVSSNAPLFSSAPVFRGAPLFSSAPLFRGAPLFSSAPLSAGEALASPQQSNVPDQAKQAESAVTDAVKKFRIGVFGGIGLDPELIEFGAHAAFGPFFSDKVVFRPGFDIGVGEITTQLGLNLDALYILPGSTTSTRWVPYVGAGVNFALSHQGFEEPAPEDAEDAEQDDEDRFDFSDTDFESGLNFIVGMRSQRGMFFEMRATAYGVSAIRLLAGFNF